MILIALFPLAPLCLTLRPLSGWHGQPYSDARASSHHESRRRTATVAPDALKYPSIPRLTSPASSPRHFAAGTSASPAASPPAWAAPPGSPAAVVAAAPAVVA